MKITMAIFGAILLPLSAVAAEDGSGFPERQVFELDGYSIEYSEGDEELAQSVLAGIVAEPTVEAENPAGSQEPMPIDASPLMVGGLQVEKELWLNGICRYLAFDEPPSHMRSAFEKVAKGFANMHGAIQNLTTDSTDRVLDLRRYTLWRREDLAARLDAGHVIPNFNKDGDSYVWELSFQWEDHSSGEETVTSQRSRAVPILINREDDVSGDELVQQLVSRVRMSLPALSRVFERTATVMSGISGMSVHTTLHEAIEAGIVWGLPLDSRDRRWFCDGVANYVAYRLIEERVGPEAAKQYYNLPEQLARYEDVEDRIDLATWPAAEDQPDDMSEDEERLNQAHYPFATQVIAKICAKHGDDLLPKLFREIQRTPAEKRNMDTVYRAFRKLTREDLRDYFPNRRR